MSNTSLRVDNLSKKMYIHDIGTKGKKSFTCAENGTNYFVFKENRMEKLIRCYSILTAIRNEMPGIAIAIAK